MVKEDSDCLSIAMRMWMSTDHKGINKFTSSQGPYNEATSWFLRRIYDSVVQSTLSQIHGNYYVFAVETSAPAFELSDSHPKDAWKEELGFQCLSLPNSGTSGCLVFKDKTNGDKFAVTFGVYKWKPWIDVVTDFKESAREIRNSYYGGKRNVRTTCDFLDSKHKYLNLRSIRVRFTVVPGKPLYLSKITVTPYPQREADAEVMDVQETTLIISVG